jgi:hypothetical protein
MVRTLIATLVMSASMAVACPTCGCTDAKAETASTTTASTKVVSDAKDCTKECTAAAEACCSSKEAAVQTVAAEKAASCSGETCPLTGAAITTVAADKTAECATECATACETACDKPCDGEKTGISFVSYMPKMTYKVGDETMGCSKMAGAKAAEQNTHMHFVVADHEYDNQAEAMTAHAKQLEGMMMDLVRIQYAVNDECVACPVEAKALAATCETKKLQYKVGPATFDNAEDAIAASIMAYNAAKSVNVQYAVGDEITTCSESAGMMADKANCSVEYVVNGNRTTCSKSAGYMKTLASVESALKALAAASSGTTAAGA